MRRQGRSRTRGKIAVAAACALALGALAVGGPAAAAQDRIVITEVEGPQRFVPPGEFRFARARCPRGTVAISAGLLLGAIEPVADYRESPRVWVSDGFNPSGFTGFPHSVEVLCMRGHGIQVRGLSSGQGDPRRGSTADALGSTGTSTSPGLRQARRDFAKGARYPSSM